METTSKTSSEVRIDKTEAILTNQFTGIYYHSFLYFARSAISNPPAIPPNIFL